MMSKLSDLEEKGFGNRTALEHVVISSHSSRPHRETAAMELAAIHAENAALRAILAGLRDALAESTSIDFRRTVAFIDKELGKLERKPSDP